MLDGDGSCLGTMFGGLHSLKLTWPLKMMVSNRNLLFQGLFSGDMLVSGNVHIYIYIFLGGFGRIAPFEDLHFFPTAFEPSGPTYV